MRVAKTIELDELTERELRVLAKRRTVQARLQQRALVVLLAAEGRQNKDIAVEAGLDRRQVALWRQRFLDGGIDALRKDAPRSGRPATVTTEMESRIVQATLHDKPIDATHWSTRTLAEHLGMGATTIRRVWQSNGLKPHLSQTFKLSRDPRFEDKLLDVVGLYMNPPEHALVLSCDEKSQIQALNRTQPGLPMKRGRAGTVTHDYKRHGTTTLFAALNTLDGSVISMCQPRHRHSEWLKFLRLIDRRTPKHMGLHLIVDNYATHSHPEVQKWLARHPRFVMHFTPTSASWLNMVERFFRDITDKRIRRDSFTSVPELELAIDLYVAEHNIDPKPFIWAASASEILAKVMGATAALATVSRQVHNRSAHYTRWVRRVDA
jgi:transposase